MKNKKTFFICIISMIFILILLATFLILGSINRRGYLNEIKYIKDNTYSFRINYYDKVFRNSDIYDVYLDIEKTIKDNNFIKDIKMDENGSPFGTLITGKSIDIDKIDNIQYTLKLKITAYFYALIIYIFIAIFLHLFKNIKILAKEIINFIKINKILILIVSLVFIILLLSLIILGSIKRIGYLNEINSIKDNIYSFRISYYDKVFRNNDIYWVYLEIEKTIKDNNFIKDIKIDENGSPFGTLITDKSIDIDKIDNIQYTLKIKNNVYLYAFIIYLFFIFLFYIFLTIKENKLILVYISILIIIQIIIYLSLYNYFRIVS